ncbi:MAG: hypothetical protein ABSA18_06155 [Dehalococcoidia bacterium]|jgi:alkylation response protein AidB-like acyl-CoA dehydrogenase
MDFRLTAKQETRKKEFYKFCAELAGKKPASYLGIASSGDIDECWDYHRHCAREFGKRGWLTFGWPKEYGARAT